MHAGKPRSRQSWKTGRESMGIAACPVWGSMPDRFWDSSTWVGSPDRMAEIGWRARIGFATGFASVVEWCRESPLATFL